MINTCPACIEHGELTRGIECPQCHRPARSQHSDTCTLAPGRVWDGWLNDANATLVDTGNQIVAVRPPCAYPRDTHGDGRGCDHDDCPRHGHPTEDEPRCGFRNLNNHEITCDYPPHPIGTAHSWTEGELPWLCGITSTEHGLACEYPVNHLTTRHSWQ